MSNEQFNPYDYKSFNDLSEDKKAQFVPIEGGFVQKTSVDKPGERPREIYANENSYGGSREEEARRLNIYVTHRDFFINEAPKLIQENDFYEGTVPVAEKLGVEVSTDNRENYKILSTLESLSRRLLEITNEFDKDASVLLSAVTDSFIKFKGVGYGSWSHTACHPIETYGRGLSFLDTPESRGILTGLVDESVKRQKEESHDIGCSNRIVSPIMDFNLTEAGLDNLEAPYVYKPKSLSDAEYVEILKNELKDEYSYNVKAFLDSNSPLECYRLILEKGSKLSGSPKAQIKLLQSLEKHLSREIVDDYVKKVYHPNEKDINYEELLQSFQESTEAHEVIKGIYVDVEGTLIRENYQGRGLNEHLVEKLNKLADEGNEIIIFTGGDVQALGEELKKFGLSERFLPVRSKNDYRGKVLEILVDDTPPEYQGFRTLELRHPGNAWF